MSDRVLETFVRSYIAASRGPVVQFAQGRDGRQHPPATNDDVLDSAHL